MRSLSNPGSRHANPQRHRKAADHKHCHEDPTLVPVECPGGQEQQCANGNMIHDTA